MNAQVLPMMKRDAMASDMHLVAQMQTHEEERALFAEANVRTVSTARSGCFAVSVASYRLVKTRDGVPIPTARVRRDRVESERELFRVTIDAELR